MTKHSPDHAATMHRVKPLKYIILFIIIAAPFVSALLVAAKTEYGSIFLDDAMMMSLYIAFLLLSWPLPLMITYDLCRSREKSLQAMVFPFLFSWLGFFLVWLLMRKKGETEYPFQKIF